MKIKVRYTYTVVRENKINQSELEETIDFFKGAICDETDEYLYGGAGVGEKVSVKMEASEDNGITWNPVN